MSRRYRWLAALAIFTTLGFGSLRARLRALGFAAGCLALACGASFARFGFAGCVCVALALATLGRRGSWHVRVGRWGRLGVGIVLALGVPATVFAAEAAVRGEAYRDRFDTVVIDAGHGGEDEGARGPHGLLEKDVVLDVARSLAARLKHAGLHVVMTRARDEFVPLEERTSIANDARADLFISIHANAAHDDGARGSETYFMSLEASDEHARGVALRENEAFAAKPGACRRRGGSARRDPRRPDRERAPHGIERFRARRAAASGHARLRAPRAA